MIFSLVQGFPNITEQLGWQMGKRDIHEALLESITLELSQIDCGRLGDGAVSLLRLSSYAGRAVNLLRSHKPCKSHSHAQFSMIK
jgi:hypothetical protein